MLQEHWALVPALAMEAMVSALAPQATLQRHQALSPALALVAMLARHSSRRWLLLARHSRRR